jgi:hypothetical protein
MRRTPAALWAGHHLSLNHIACNICYNGQYMGREGSGTWRGWAGTMLRDPPPPSNDGLSSTQQKHAVHTAPP